MRALMCQPGGSGDMLPRVFDPLKSLLVHYYG